MSAVKLVGRGEGKTIGGFIAILKAAQLPHAAARIEHVREDVNLPKSARTNLETTGEIFTMDDVDLVESATRFAVQADDAAELPRIAVWSGIAALAMLSLLGVMGYCASHSARVHSEVPR